MDFIMIRFLQYGCVAATCLQLTIEFKKKRIVCHCCSDWTTCRGHGYKLGLDLLIWLPLSVKCKAKCFTRVKNIKSKTKKLLDKTSVEAHRATM